MNLDDLRDVLRLGGFTPLFEGHPDSIFVFTTDGRFVAGNPAMMARGGYSPEQLDSMRFCDFLHEGNVDNALAEFEAAAAGERRQYVASSYRADGTIVRGQITHVPFIHNGEILAVFGMVKDVGTLESALAQDESSQRLLRTAGRIARFGGWRMDLATSETAWSDEVYEILGYPPNEKPPDGEAVLAPSSADGIRVAEAIARCSEFGESYDVEADVVDVHGSTLRLRVLGEAVRDSSGAIVAIQGSVVDVTERESGRRAEVRLAHVLGSLSDSLVFLDADWVVTYMNPRAEVLMGIGADDAVGRVIWDLFPEASASEFSIAYRQAIRENRRVTVLDFYPPLNIWVEATAYPTGDGLAVYLRDVTESESVRQELRVRSAEVAAQSALLDNARDAIIVRGLDSTIRYWNAAATRIYGWTRDEIMGRHARDLLYPEPTQFDHALEAAVRQGHWSGELRQIDKSGTRLDVDSSWTLVRDEHGRPESVFSVNTDITGRRSREELDLRTQRMESLGTLASGMAHDLNNVLTPILLAVQLLAPGETDAARREILSSTELAVKRGADMIRQVLSFASGANGRRVAVSISEVLAELESLRIDTLPANISLRFDVAEDLWSTSGDPTQLLQVLLNLVTNARDAMPDGGTITIRAHNVTLDDDFSAGSLNETPGDYVRVEVKDDGIGMRADVLTKIFEPFFTTKATGAGTGLGLSTSIAIIRGHGGYMHAYSEPGRGSLFRLHLLADGQRAAPDESAITYLLAESPRGDGELVLVVDDDAAIRALTRQTLEAYGYTTAVASNGSEAIEFIESGRADVALVLTDMAMPVMDGAATAAYLLRHHPGLPVVAASGLIDNEAVARAHDSGIRSFLAKPYTTSELLSALYDGLHPE